MKAELSFTFESIEELHDFTAKMAVPVSVDRTQPPLTLAAIGKRIESGTMTDSAPAEEPRATKTRKVTKAASPDAPAPTSAAEVEDGTGAVTQEEVRAAITAVNDKFGLVPARKVLTKFGVKRIPELKPEQYADFVKACKEVK